MISVISLAVVSGYITRVNTYHHVFELMTRNPYCARPETLISEFVRELVSRKATAAPVINAAEELVGLLSLVDLAVQPGGWDHLTVGRLMQLRVHCVEHSDTLASAAARMQEHRVHRLVVTDGQHVVGMISCLDLLPIIWETSGGRPYV